LNVGRALEAARILEATHVLPSENSRESHRLWEQTFTMLAIEAFEDHRYKEAIEDLMAALEWPESLGQGRPYETDERLVRFILGQAEERLGNEAGARAAYEAFLEGMDDVKLPLQPLDLLVVQTLIHLGRPAEAAEIYRAFESEFDALQEGLDRDLDGRLIYRAFTMGIGQE
jgi:tetratricopeptide (TPR) repeat protein